MRPALLASALSVAACVQQERVQGPPIEGARALILAAPSSAGRGHALAVEPLAASAAPLDAGDGDELLALLYDDPLGQLGITPGPLELAPRPSGCPLPFPARLYHRPATIRDWIAHPAPRARLEEIGVVRGDAVVEELAADFSCRPAACPVLARRAGCGVEFESRCSSWRPPRASIDLQGGLHIPSSEALGVCSPAPALAGAISGARCTREVNNTRVQCRVELVRPGLPGPVDATRVQLVTPSRRRPDDQIEIDGEVRALDVRRAGWIAGLVVLDGAIMAGVRQEAAGPYCVGDVPGTFTFVDPETLAITATRPAPSCLTHLIADPEGGGFFAVHGPARGSMAPHRAAQRLARYDRDARLLEEVSISPETGVNRFAHAITILDEGRRLAIVMRGDVALQPPPLSEIHELSLSALWAPPVVTSSLGPFLNDITPYEGRTVLAIDRGAPDGEMDDRIELRALYSVDLERSTTEGQTARLALRCGLDFSNGFLEHIALGPSGQVLITTSRSFAATLVLDPPLEGSCHGVAPALPFVPEFDALEPWPADRSRMLVGMTHLSPGGDDEAYVGLLDVQQERFVPGLTEIGRGVVGSMSADPQGRVWATLPWSGEIVRLEPR